MSNSQDDNEERKDTKQIAITLPAYDALKRMAEKKAIKSIGTLASIIIQAEDKNGAYTDFLG